MKASSTAAVLLSISLLLLPLFYWFEYSTPTTWAQRLLIPFLEEEPTRHTPRFSQGTYLPARITRNTTLTAADNPILVAHATVVAPQVTLTISPGSHLYFHEFGQLQVAGTLVIAGTPAQPVTLRSNELHPQNQTWGGIVVTEKGTSTITFAELEDASPGLSCLPGSTVAGSHTTLLRGSVGLYTASATCTLADSTINGAREGVIAVGTLPHLPNTRVSATKTQIRQIKNTTP